MEMATVDLKRQINRFVKRLEKKGFITKKIEKANYRKVRILASNDNQFRRIMFVTKGDREVFVDIDLFAVFFNPATYLNHSFHDVVAAIKAFDKEAKGSTHVEHTNA